MTWSDSSGCLTRVSPKSHATPGGCDSAHMGIGSRQPQGGAAGLGHTANARGSRARARPRPQTPRALPCPIFSSVHVPGDEHVCNEGTRDHSGGPFPHVSTELSKPPRRSMRETLPSIPLLSSTSPCKRGQGPQVWSVPTSLQHREPQTVVGGDVGIYFPGRV